MRTLVICSLIIFLVLSGCTKQPTEISELTPSSSNSQTNPPTTSPTTSAVTPEILMETVLIPLPITVDYIPVSGDWVVNGNLLLENASITLNGNLVIDSGASLTLRDVELGIACESDGEHGISVRNGSSIIIERTSIAPVNGNRFFFRVRDARLEMRNSTLRGCGWPTALSPYDFQNNGLAIEVSQGSVIEDSTFTDNYYGVILNAVSDAIVRNNTFISNGEGGIMLSVTDHSTITGNTFTAVGSNFYSACMFGVKGQHAIGNIIAENTFNGNYGEAPVWLFGESEHNTISGNIIDIEGSWAGIALGSNCSQIANNNLVTGNTIIGGGNGIAIYHSGNNRIEDNTITDAVLGITLGGADRNDIVGNTIVTTRTTFGYKEENAIELYDSSYNVVAYNHVSSAPEHGILLFNSSRDNVLEGNTVETCHIGIGIYNNADGNRVEGNTITDSAVSNIHLQNTNENAVTSNNFIGDACPPYDDADNAWEKEGKGNYWSAYTGIDANGDGIGDTPFSISDTVSDEYPLVEPSAIQPGDVPLREDIPIPTIPRGSPDRLVIDTNVTWENEVIDFTDRHVLDLIVADGGVLTLRNVTLVLPWYFDRILVETGGTLKVYGSKILPAENAGGYEFTIQREATLVMIDSEVKGVGFGPLSSDWGSLKIMSLNVTIEGCIISDSCRGITTDMGSIAGSMLSIKRNTFLNCYIPIWSITYFEGHIEDNIILNNFFGEQSQY